MASWNVALVIAGLLLIALICEAYLRLANPFIETSVPYQFVDGVGLIREPNAELRYANWDDNNFVVSRVNSLGFLDREPVSAERAAAGCHIAFIGDSYVEAQEVPIADKFHVRLEEMAARELPHLDITTQAYGIGVTAQINQIPYYDEYARRLSPKLVVLVFFTNDFYGNSTVLQSLAFGADPDRMPFMFAQRDSRGVMKLRPPDPEYERFLLPRLPKAWHVRVRERLTRISYFAKWMEEKLWEDKFWHQRRAWADMLAERPNYAWLLDGWKYDEIQYDTEENLPAYLKSELEYTAFGIEQFKRRADRDGATLLIMAATDIMGTRGDPQFDRLNVIAKTYGIPVISQYDYMVSQAYNPPDARWRTDIHWNATGHQWAAEAVLEWLNANQDVCD